MPNFSRRGFLGAAAAATGAAVVGTALPDSAQAATATTAAKPPTPGKSSKPGRPSHPGPARPHGDLRDIKHVVILMQENRSFDHYFGSLRGVRGFGDRSTITLPGGLSVFEQPLSAPGSPLTGTQYPWRLADAPVSAY